jgi:hypothetical protein
VSEDSIFFLASVLPLSVIVGGVVIIVMAMRQRALTLEMKHRERMAMIEKGLLTAPERNPAAFEAVLQRHDQVAEPPGRSISFGVIIVALGVGFMLMVGFAAEAPGPAVGIGGAVVVLGLAFIVNGELKRRSQPPPPPSWQRPYSSIPPSAPGPTDPAGPVGP